ncbi:MAG: hypothetical protein S0880_13790 [Actinomycetota bacterium]|nr:hypothetical protein [Actinomycetota bacterium]
MSWGRLARAVVGGLPAGERDTGREILGLLDDADENGRPPGPLDVGSVLWLVVRVRSRRAVLAVLAGVPVAVPIVFAYVLVSASFGAWDVMEEVPSTEPAVIAVRSALGWTAWTILPLAAWAGAAAIRCFEDRRPVLPVLLLGTSMAIALLASRTSQTAGSLRPGDVDHVPALAVALLVASHAVPLLFLAVARHRRGRSVAA